MTKENSNNKMTRRGVLKGTSALAIPTFMPKSVFGANEKKINIAWVGFGNMGWGDLNNCSNGNNVVALCDCNPGTWERAKKKFPKAKFYKDFRKMLEEMGDQIDAVGVGTPDHSHFAIAYTAMSMGKHVFVEKPLVHSLWEARTLQALAKEKGLVTQMGNQGHAFEGAYLVKEWYEAGLIGEVKEVLTWTDRPARGWGFNGQVRTEYPKAEKLPEGMDWNLWLGPCQEDVPFSRAIHPTTWRPWWSFGCGGLGDIGCHTIDTAYWAFGVGARDKVVVYLEEKDTPIHKPNGSIVTYKFPSRGKQPAVDVKWIEGPRLPKAPNGYDWDIKGHGGFIMVGEKGGISHDGMRPNSPRLYPKARWEDYRKNANERVPKTLKRVPGIHNDWVNGIRNNEKTVSDFSYSGPLTESIILGTLAIRTGKGLEWNAKDMKITGNKEAAALINVEARKGWRTSDLV
ncbi:MAG: Gfo/Idh/MocA family oxidoreductase [Verrucomicrobiales bacterium]|nr:Gfo/Idh/MocA family oxidoreductase [Verrucomicrobiales bacterium]